MKFIEMKITVNYIVNHLFFKSKLCNVKIIFGNPELGVAINPQ